MTGGGKLKIKPALERKACVVLCAAGLIVVGFIGGADAQRSDFQRALNRLGKTIDNALPKPRGRRGKRGNKRSRTTQPARAIAPAPVKPRAKPPAPATRPVRTARPRPNPAPQATPERRNRVSSLPTQTVPKPKPAPGSGPLGKSPHTSSVTSSDTPSGTGAALLPAPIENPAPLFEKCANLASGLDVDLSPLPPILTERGCGQVMPLKLRTLKVAASPAQTVIKPAATTNCALTAALGRWLDGVAQPFALKLFNSPVIRINNVSSYVCRTRNHRPGARLSEHAHANALDVAGLVLEDGTTLSVKKHWGEDSAKGRYLYILHRQACGIFKTVLGPTSDANHHDHFHFDMAARRYGAYCR